MNTNGSRDALAHLRRLEELKDEIAILRHELGLTESAFQGIPLRTPVLPVDHPACDAGIPTLAA